MRNLNEPRKTDESRRIDESRKVDEPRKTEGEVVPFEQRTPSAQQTPVQETGPMLPKNEAEDLQSRWNTVQGNFVDEPRKTIEEADKLVASAIQRISQAYDDARVKLEESWKRGEHVSTEDLRVTLQRYRAFFTRLTSI